MRIEIRGTPIAKQSFKRFKNMKTGQIHNFRDPKIEEFNNSVISQITNQLPPDYIPMSKAIRINYLEFRFKIPKNWNKKLMSIVSDPNSIWQICKDNQKDCDNLLKAIGDTFNGIIWIDDKLIVEICNIRKIYSQIPGITIDFEEIKDYCGKLPLLPKFKEKKESMINNYGIDPHIIKNFEPKILKRLLNNKLSGFKPDSFGGK